MSYGEPNELLDRDDIFELFIDLEDSDISQDDPRCNQEASKRLKKVRQLDLKNLLEEDTKKTLQLFDIFETTVREIDLRECQNVGEFGYHHLTRRVVFCKQLRVLSVDVDMLSFFLRCHWMLARLKLQKLVIDTIVSYDDQMNAERKLLETSFISQFVHALGSVGHLEFTQNYVVYPGLFRQLGTVSSIKVHTKTRAQNSVEFMKNS